MTDTNRPAFKKMIHILSEKIRTRLDEHANVCFRGMLYDKLKDYEKAINDFDSLIDKFPLRGELYYLRGHSYYAMQNFKKAKRDLLKGMSLEKSKDSMDYKNYKPADFEIKSEQELQSIGRVLEFEFNNSFTRLALV